MLVGQKWHVHREVVISRIQEMCGVNLAEPSSGEQIVKAIAALETLRVNGFQKAYVKNRGQQHFLTSDRK
jgi:hypothetical protein